MGRGRAKAKQTKVARRLKYQTFETDFDALQRELRGEESEDEPDEDDEPDYYGGDAAGYVDEEDQPRRHAG